MRFLIFLLLALSLAPSFADEPPVPENLISHPNDIKEMRRFYGVGNEYLGQDNPRLSEMKIALLTGRGVQGIFSKSPADVAMNLQLLPPTVEAIVRYTEQPDEEMLDPNDSSGRRLAQLMWAFLGYPPNGPKINIYNAKVLRSFSKAVQRAQAWQPDVLISTENVQILGNFNGTGGLDQMVDDVARSSTLWIQSAGESSTRVFNSAVKLSALPDEEEQGLLTFERNGTWYVRLQVNSDLTDTEIYLGWNALEPGRVFRGTDKDLDMCIYPGDQTKFPIAPLKGGCSNQRQVVGEAAENETRLPSERIRISLQKATLPYLIAVRRIRGDFDSTKDKLRISVSTKKRAFFDGKLGRMVLPLEFLDATENGSVGMPADSRWAFTIGAESPLSSMGPTADGRQKPDAVLDRPAVTFSDQGALEGPDVAAAQFAAMTVMLAAKEPTFEWRHLKALIAESQLAGALNEADRGRVKWLRDAGWQIGMDKIKLDKAQKERAISFLENKVVGYREIKGRAGSIGLNVPPTSLDQFKSISDIDKTLSQPGVQYFFVRLDLPISQSSVVVVDGKRYAGPWEKAGNGNINDWLQVEEMLPDPQPPAAASTQSKTWKMPSAERLRQVVKN